ncbi:MAG: TetR/AcrR family transcriptional regulator [Sedimentisphaerales bacterium]|nr:TetR/AcrR family transcriptional regulator [Sedimentisphaerales bacterium]
MVPENVGYQVKNGCCKCDVENRLLDAAEKLFSEKGFSATSVRDLTSEAGCNVAAVNYHFGNKELLYKAMFKRHLEQVFGFHKDNIKKVMSSENPTIEKLTEALVRPMLEHSSEKVSQMPMLKLTVRESLNPQFKKEVVELEIIKDFLTEIQKAILVLFPKLKPQKAMLCVFSLEGMVIHPLLFGEFYHDIAPDLAPDDLINHIVQFASDAIRKAAKE